MAEIDLFDSGAEEAYWSCHVTLHAPAVQFDRDGNLIEDLASLEALKRIGDGLGKVLGARGEIGDILATCGRYMLVIRIRLKTLERGETPKQFVANMIQRIEAGKEALEQSRGAEPRLPHELGVDTDQLRLIHALVRAPISNESPLTVADVHGEEVASLAAPSAEAVANIPAGPPRMQAVDGPVTGVGFGDDRGARIEVSRSLTAVVPGSSLDELVGHLRARRHVRGTIVREASPVFSEFAWHDPLFCDGE